MGLVGWLVAVGCMFIGAAASIWGLTEINKHVVIWLIGVPGGICLVVALGFEIQKFLGEEHVHSESEIRQLRAYITVTKTEIRNLGDGLTPQIHIVFKNSGQTPAYDVRGWDGNALDEFPPKIPFAVDPIIESVLSGSTVGREGEWHIVRLLSAPLTLAHFQALGTGKFAIYAWGTLRYRDTFGMQRKTDFRVYYGGDYGLPQSGVMGHMREGNDAN